MSRNRIAGDTFDERRAGIDVTTEHGFDAYYVTAVPRTVTLDPNAVQSDGVMVVDTTGLASGVDPITIRDVTGHTIIGEGSSGTSIKIAVAFGSLQFYFSKGLNAWVVVAASGGAGGGGESTSPTFVLRPGNPAGNTNNVFIDWASLYDVFSLVSGNRWIYVDDSLATATVPAGTWNVDLTTFVGNFASTTEILHFADGAHLQFNTIWIDGLLTLSQDGASPVFTLTNAQNFAQIVILQGNLLSTTATAFVRNSNTTPGDDFFIDVQGEATIGDDVHPVVTTDAGALSVISLGAGSSVGASEVILAHALAGLGTAEVVFADSQSGLHPTQDVTTITRTQPGLNFSTTQNGSPLGPAGTVQQTSAAFTRIRLGRIRVYGSISGVTSVAATVTVTLLRDAVTIAQAVVSTQADDLTYAVALSIIDLAPDSAAHTYAIQAVSGAGTTTVADQQATLNVEEL